MKEKRETGLRVGDRVAVYSGGRTLGTVAKSISDEMIEVKWDEVNSSGYLTCVVHPKQCRRLVRKERRRVWISFANIDHVESEPFGCRVHVWNNKPDFSEIVEFIEVVRKKK